MYIKCYQNELFKRFIAKIIGMLLNGSFFAFYDKIKNSHFDQNFILQT